VGIKMTSSAVASDLIGNKGHLISRQPAKKAACILCKVGMKVHHRTSATKDKNMKKIKITYTIMDDGDHQNNLLLLVGRDI
jgi:hypothetical protein